MTTTTWNDLLHPGDATDFFSRRPACAFDPATHAYKPANAIWLAELSRLVYRHDKEEDAGPRTPTRLAFLEKAGLTQRQFFLSRETHTQAMLVESKGAAPFAVLVFRGTEQHISDFLVDLKLGEISFNSHDKKKTLHQGFTQALDSVWHDIDAALGKLPPACPVFYTGHSLGAALATLAAARRAPKAVYAFGSPRVGNQAFVDSLAGIAIHRVVDDADVVATIPPEIMDFRHAGNERRLHAPDSPFSLQHLFDPPKALADHAPINYVDRI
jgi:triacylglycerol lipase